MAARCGSRIAKNSDKRENTLKLLYGFSGNRKYFKA